MSLSIKVSTYVKWKPPCLTAFKRGRRIETRAYGVSGWNSFWFGDAAKPDFNFREHAGIAGVGAPGSNAPATGSASGEPVVARIDAGSIAEMVKPRGTQDVRVINQQPVSVPVYATFNITGASDPKAVADEAVSRLANAVRSATESSFSD